MIPYGFGPMVHEWVQRPREVPQWSGNLIAPRLNTYLFVVRSELSAQQRLQLVGFLSSCRLPKACKATWGRTIDEPAFDRPSGLKFFVGSNQGFDMDCPDLVDFRWALLESFMDHVAPVEVVVRSSPTFRRPRINKRAQP